MSRRYQPLSVATKTLEKAVRLIRLEAEAATLEALSAKDGIVVLQPAESPQWSFTDIGSVMNASNGATVSFYIYHGVRSNGYPVPHWLASESRTDGNGRRWTLALGRHVVDDFGTLVPAESGAA